MTEDDLLDLFRPLAPVSLKKMFGGISVYVEGLIVAIAIDGAVYMKADTETKPQFQAAGLTPFSYEAKGKTATMNYWALPEEAYEDPDSLRPWFRLALEAARRAGASKPKKAKKALKPS